MNLALVIWTSVNSIVLLACATWVVRRMTEITTLLHEGQTLLRESVAHRCRVAEQVVANAMTDPRDKCGGGCGVQ